jgi:hypothetical protein
MPDRMFNEAQAAAMLPGKPSAATLKRWRLSGKVVDFFRQPGGRIFYSFEQIVGIGAAMCQQSAVPTCSDVIQSAPINDDTCGAGAIAAE